jgi:hypothetical protein
MFTSLYQKCINNIQHYKKRLPSLAITGNILSAGIERNKALDNRKDQIGRYAQQLISPKLSNQNIANDREGL